MAAKKLAPIAIANEPSDKWTLDELGTYVGEMVKRSAADLWRIGKTLAIVRLKAEHGKWEEWCAKHVPEMSKSTISRAITVANTVTLEFVQHRSRIEVYRHLGLAAPAPIAPKPATTATTPATTSTTEDNTSNEDIRAQDTEDTGKDEDRSALSAAEELADKIVSESPQTVALVEAALKEIAKLIDYELPDAKTAIRLLITPV